MTGRIFSNVEYLALKAAVRNLTKQAGGVDSAASITRSDAPRLSRYGSPNEDMHAPIDVVADLERDVSAPIVTRVLAELQGYLLVKKLPTEGDPEWIGHLGRLGKEAGEVIARLSEALSNDGKITATEIKELDLIVEVREAQEALASIETALKAVLVKDDK